MLLEPYKSHRYITNSTCVTNVTFVPAVNVIIMTSEEHIQLESSSAPVSSNGFHDAQHVQTALDPSPVSEPMTITSTHTAEVLAQTQERDLSATVEEVELTTVLDRTLVEEGNGADASMPKARFFCFFLVFADDQYF
jgi:hypothetical protein